MGTCATALAVAAAATLLWRALGSHALIDDGPQLVAMLANAADGPPVYYHAAYLPLGWLAAALGAYPPIAALLWASAASAGVGLGLAVIALRRLTPGARAWPFALALAGSPGLWVAATYVEVHATQFFGAALLLVTALAARGAAPPSAMALLAAGLTVAIACHNSNLSLALGAVWIAAAAPGAEWRPPGRAVLWCTLGALIGCLAGMALNGLSPLAGGETSGQVAGIARLLTEFYKGPSLNFMVQEWVFPWLPCLVATACIAFAAKGAAGHSWRESGAARSAPFLVAALPGCALFLVQGIETLGGYFVSSSLFLVAGAAAAQGAHPTGAGAGRRLLSAAVPSACLLAIPLIADGVNSERRAHKAWLAETRRDAALALLPRGGWVVDLVPHGQTLLAWDTKRREVPLELWLSMAQTHGIPPERAAAEWEQGLELLATRELPLLVHGSFDDLGESAPELEPYAAAAKAALEQHYTLEPIEFRGMPLLLGHPH